MPIKLTLTLLLTAAALAAPAHAQSTTPAQLLAGYEAAAGAPARAERGQAFFTSRQGGEWSCASCHGQRPTSAGRHAVTAKSIDALAPAFNPKAFTDERRVEKWFRRNCKDVAQRECTPGEKADVLAWLQTLR
ncbi:DUF1924 domain-containing protein [Roseateles paludis]|jgi:cytochrome c553|uniref:DUF1924 domain-containing protein n=1 Tax=Roseateles paludis TaxID=3145238 RepID=A0ABV0G1Z3_9BURK